MVTPDAALAEAKTALKIIEIARKQGWLDRLVTLLRRKHKILVLGSSGVGKTACVESLTWTVPRTIDQINRTQFAQKHSIRLARQPFIFIDTPGQKLHGPRRLEAIRDAMKGRISGIVNVVSYGYHEYRIGKDVAIRADGAAREEFLRRHRQMEIQALSEWSSLLGGRDAANWLITLVTKADLWWGHRHRVLQHYSEGAYFEALGPAKALTPTVLEYCSVFQKFFGQAAMSGEFGDADRTRVRGQLIATLLASVGEADS